MAVWVPGEGGLRGYGVWPRDPAGPALLEEVNTPRGLRTPNGLVWGHDISDLYMIQRVPGVAVMTVWSISMIREFGECYQGHEDESTNAVQRMRMTPDLSDAYRTRVLRPFPLLKLPPGVECGQELGVEDEGCDRGCLNISDHVREQVISHGELDLDIEPSKQELQNLVEVDHFTQDRYQSETLGETKLPPKLEEFIPNNFLPNILLVHDPDDCAFGTQGAADDFGLVTQYNAKERGLPADRNPPIVPYRQNTEKLHRYRPALPVCSSFENGDSASGNLTGYLDLSGRNLHGVGHHSSVYRAALTLPGLLTANHRSSNGKVTVIAKMAFPSSEPRKLLENEAKILASLAKHRKDTQQEWCGLNAIRGLLNPVPVGAIVPKFHGYFVPDDESGHGDDQGMHVSILCRPHRSRQRQKPRRGLSPILLMEDCGVPVEAENLGLKAQCEIYSMFLRLHDADVVHNSPYVRNILVQPGPLTVLPAERSLRTPSFRLIDFGRSLKLSTMIKEVTGDHTEEERRDIARRDFCFKCQMENRRAAREIGYDEV